MANSVCVASEAFQPIPLRFDSSFLSGVKFGLRRAVDLQLATIWTFLAPELPQLEGKVLDVGCGEMPFRCYLPATVDYTGIDVPQAGAFQMRGNGDVVAFDGLQIPFEDNSFATVLCTEVLEHAAMPDELIAEMRRVLKPGGKLLVTVPFAARVHYAPYDFHRFTRFALAAKLKSFEAVSIKERGNDWSVIANKLIVLTARLLRPTPRLALYFPSLVLLIPTTLLFLFAAHLTLALGLGSKDDPLGYAVTARKGG